MRDILGRALETRDRFETGEITDNGRFVLRGRLRAELKRLVIPIKAHPGNEKFAAFLELHLDDVFQFLRQPGIDATNYRAEQAIRPAVVNRKVCDKRTAVGARDQSILMSVLRACHKLDLDALQFLSQTRRAPSVALAPTLGR